MVLISPDVIEYEAPMTVDDARQLTSEIRGHLSDARKKILDVYHKEAYRLMGYDSFKEWAIGEFEISWQQVYNLKAAAEVDTNLENMLLFSPTGDPYVVPVNHARELRKLKSAEGQARAYQLAVSQADAQGESSPTASIISNTVQVVKAEEVVKESPFKVVQQMVADGGVTAVVGKQIVAELEKLDDEPAQAFVQKLMAEKNLSNPELVYPLGHKHKNERQKGKESKVLDELEKTGRLAGALLAEARAKDLERANKEAQAEHITDAQELKRQKQLQAHKDDPDNNPLPPEQLALTVWKRDPIKTLQNLERDLSVDDMDALFYLMAEARGFVRTEAQLTGDPYTKKPIPETGRLLAVGTFNRNGLECNQADSLEMIIRVKDNNDG